MANLRSTFLASHTTRNVALSVLISIPLGNLLVESGNLLARALGLTSHNFNSWFLVVGILGMCSFGFALFCRRDMDNNSIVGKLR